MRLARDDEAKRVFGQPVVAKLPWLKRQPQRPSIEAVRAFPGYPGWLVERDEVRLIAYEREGADGPDLAPPDFADDDGLAG
jgi:hypothetical protein